MRRAVEKVKGRKYTVSGDLLLPADIDQRIERQLQIDGLDVTAKNKKRLFDEVALFAATGISPDDKDMLDVDRKFYRDPLHLLIPHDHKREA